MKITSTTELEHRTTIEQALPLRAGDYEGPVVRVAYRPFGTRRWTRFLLVPDEGQSIDELRDFAGMAAQIHHAKVSS